jgi:hypothetical protein
VSDTIQSPPSAAKRTRDQYLAIVRTAAKGAPFAELALRTGGHCYVRRPTPEEYDLFASYSGVEGDARTQAFKAYVRGCFLGAIDREGLELSLDECVSREGPAWLTGRFGGVVNQLSGAVGEERVTFF